MADLTVFHNPACTTSRVALEQAEASPLPVTVIQYLKTPPTKQDVIDLLAKLEDPPADLVRKDSYFTGLGLNAADYVSPDAIADLLVEHPRLMQRPVLVRGNRAIIGRPRERIAPFLAE